MDIYKFQMPNQFEVAPTTFVEGFVKDSLTQKPLEVYLDTKIRGRVKTDEKGRFFFCLLSERDLSIAIKQEGYFPFKDRYSIPKWDNKILYPLAIYLQPKPRPTTTKVTIPTPSKDTILKTPEPIFITVYFDFNDFGLNPRATKMLDKLFATFEHTDFKKVEIIGYADTSGSSNYNLDLGKREEIISQIR